jgi:C4-dicarboxylate-specific signal transduction histidine kinase
VNALREEVQMYRTLSTAGITSAVFAHESRHPIRLILSNSKQVERRAKRLLGARYAETLERSLKRILRQADALSAFGNLTLSFVDHEKRRTSKVEIHTVINNVLAMFDMVLKERHVDVIPDLAEGNPYLRGSEAAVESIISNLLINSIKAFERTAPGDRKIMVVTTVNEKRLSLRMLDNGPGIKDININDIWLPGETTYPDGTGLGLTIVRDTVTDLGGRVDAVANGELGGAEIIIEVPIIGG